MRAITIITAVTLLTACSLQADLLVNYGIDDNSTMFDPSIVGANVSAGDLTNGPSVVRAQIDQTSALAVSGRSMYTVQSGFYGLNEASAISNGDYLSFDMTVDPGFAADLSSLEFYTLRQEADGAGAPSAWSLYSSADGFSAQLGTGAIDLTTSSTFTQQAVDLSALPNVTGNTDFRIYMWAGEGLATPSERVLRVDEISLSGTVIPEPTTLGLTGLVGLGLLLARRKALIQH